MSKVPLTKEQTANIKPGETITLATVMAIMAIALVAIIAYKIFISGDGSIELPGGYEFTWN